MRQGRTPTPREDAARQAAAMRHGAHQGMRWLGGTAVALACAALAGAVLGAPAAAGAQHDFVATRSGSVRASAISEIDLALRPFSISCKTAKTLRGPIVAFPVDALYLQVSFGRCSTAPLKIGKTSYPTGRASFKAPVDVELHASGYAEIGAEGGSTKEMKAPKAIEVNPGDGSQCALAIAAQVVPGEVAKHPYGEYEAALYQDIEEPNSNRKFFPDGIQGKLVVQMLFTKLSYTTSEGACAELGYEEHGAGELSGRLRAELRNADLGWE